jgi:16S rRNA (uracil1498-N3)-methyltransferase
MRLYRFFVGNEIEVGKKELRITTLKDSELLNQLIKVLRVKSGDFLTLIRISEAPPFNEFTYKVINAHKKEVSLNLVEQKGNISEFSNDLNLAVCIPNKPDKLSFIIQKATELGVKTIQLLTSDFTNLKHNLRTDRLEKIAKEAAEQSERGMVPIIITELTLREFLKNSDDKKIFVAMERTNSNNQTPPLFPDEEITILIGPEGGFSNDEKALIENSNAQIFSLGNRILRMETAMILSLGLASLQRT